MQSSMEDALNHAQWNEVLKLTSSINLSSSVLDNQIVNRPMGLLAIELKPGVINI